MGLILILIIFFLAFVSIACVIVGTSKVMVERDEIIDD